MTAIIDKSSHNIQSAPYQDFNLLAWPAGHSMDWHQHQFLQFIHVLDGRLELDWGDGWQRMERHQVHVLPPGHRHRLRSPGGHQQFGINFMAQEDERGLLQRLHELHSAPGIFNSGAPDMEWLQDRERSTQLAALDCYCAALIRQHHSDGEQIRQQLLNLLQRHLHDSSDVSAWAAELHMSRASIQRHAHDCFGCGLASVHEELRMQHSAGRLLSSTDSVAAIADQYGFADATSFGRAFKRHFQMTPGQWRKQGRHRGA